MALFAAVGLIVIVIAFGIIGGIIGAWLDERDGWENGDE